MSDLTTNLALPYLAAAQAQKHVTHNEALRLLDAVVQMAALSRERASPPGDPAEGDRYIVATGASGDWAGKTGLVAARLDGVWEFLEPKAGWIAWVEDEAKLLVYVDDTSGWTNFATAAGFLTAALVATGLTEVGVNTAADGTNRLSVKSDAVLLSHDDVTPGSGDMRLKFNKKQTSATASLLFQTDWSGRAEVGLSGDDRFHFKVSGDGANWLDALVIDPGTGALSLVRDLAVSNGGTGASTCAMARYNLGFRANIPKRRFVTGAPWLSSTSAADNNWYAVCWSPELGLFVAVSAGGTGNRVMTSPDGIAWTARVTPVDNDWRSVCWSSELGLFVAVATSGTGNRVMTSPDGINWTVRTSAADNSWFSVCWAAEIGLFVAVSAASSGASVMTSPDGITWTIRTVPVANSWYAVCWSPELGLLVAVATSGTASNRVMTSPNGINWTVRTSAADNQWRSVCWSPELGLFVAVADSGTGNRVMTSPNGIIWTVRTSAADNGWFGVCWAGEIGLFVAVAYSGTGTLVMTSPDGIAWTVRTSAADNQWRSVCWSPDLGLAVAVSYTGTGNRVMTSVSAHALTYRSN